MDGKCPACRAGDQEIKLKNNAVVDDAVEAFQRARKDALEFARRGSVEGLSARIDERKEKRRLEVAYDEEDDGPRKRTRSSTKKAPHTAEQPIVLDSDGDDDDDYVEETTEAESSRRTRESSTNDGLVQCPICQGRMTELQIDRHIDQCTGIPPPARSGPSPLKGTVLKSSMNSAKPVKIPVRLPQLHYGMIKDNVLKKKLGELGLSANGSRTILEKRYTEWVTLVNANCDAKKPRSKKELLKDLDVWEKTQGSRAPMTNGSGNMIKDKDFDGAAWASKHEDSFRDLIANAKKKQVRLGTPSSAFEQPKPSIPASTIAGEITQSPSAASHVTLEHPSASDVVDASTPTQHLKPETSEIDGGHNFNHTPIFEDDEDNKDNNNKVAAGFEPPPSSQLGITAKDLENIYTAGKNTLPPL